MNTLSTLLQSADPLGYEPPRDRDDLFALRRAELSAPRTAVRPHRSLLAVAAIVLVTAVASAAIVTRFAAPGVADVQAAVRFEVRLAETAFSPGLREVALDATRRIYLHQDVLLDNSDVVRAEMARDAGATFSVVVAFTAAGAAKMRRATRDHLGRPIALLIEVVAAPVVRSEIGDSAVINGIFTRGEADRIAGGLLGR
jgi:hypothetical protein